MKTTILLRQVSIGEDVKTILEKKLKKLDKFFDDEVQAFVTLSRKREKEILELTISSRGTIFRSEVEAQSFLHAIDPAVAIIDRQIRKNKTRLERRLREGAFTVPSDPEDGPVDEEKEFRVHKKQFALKPMSTEEAILQMNLVGHEFFVYEDSESGEVNVVYRRKDGEYGLIETSR
ncbi:MAG: ribosome-associated translation inhibitor RaiA [Ruminococcus sp.]|nr:ribosome-associated translation inhibitor RaiA [Candidatus Apopatosoma intestinale]